MAPEKKSKDQFKAIDINDNKWTEAFKKEPGNMIVLDDYKMLLPIKLPISRKYKKLTLK